MKKLSLFVLALCLGMATANAQDTKLTREQVLSMSIEELSELPLEDLMAAVELLEVKSVDELFALIMNKNVSSASKSEESSFVSPLSSTVITRSELREYGISTIEEAFRLIPGMIVSEKTNGVYDVQMRGLNNIPDNNMLLYTENMNTLIMIDGRISHNYAFGGALFDVLPISIEDIERIEVVRGANSALYGANAVTGIINIITEKPGSDSKLVSGSIQMGNHSTAVGEIAIRKNFNERLSMGVTANLQLRRRPTDKLYIIPATGVYLPAEETDAAVNTSVTQAELGAMLQDGTLTDVSAGGYFTLNEIERMRQIYTTDNTNYTFYDVVEPQTPLDVMFDDPALSRKSSGINGYIAYELNKNIRFDLSGGYQQSKVNSTSINTDYFPFNVRESKTGYGNLNARVFDFNLNVNYTQGPQNYAIGNPGFKVNTYVFNSSLEYDLNIGGLGIRPGVSYQYIKYKDYDPGYYDANHNGQYDSDDPNERLVGYFGTLHNGELQEGVLKALGVSLRLDYKVGDWRFIAAVRGDKTAIPDEWNPSYQGVVGYSINDKNYVRAVYGHSMRSTNMVQANSNYCWQRTNLVMPTQIEFLGNEDAKLVKIDNFELGYRLQPTPTLLIDAEAFYSQSEDYGELMSVESQAMLYHNDLLELIPQLTNSDFNLAEAASVFKSKSYIQYNNVPFKVQQFGFGVNIDWIISPKLIAKVNANVQKTTIDNYYQYNQTATIRTQLYAASQAVQTQLPLLFGDLKTGIEQAGANAGAQGQDPTAAAQKYMNDVLGYTPIDAAFALYEQMSASEKESYLNSLLAAYNGTGPAIDGVDKPMGLYYSLKYGVRFDRRTNSYYMYSTRAIDPELSNDHDHKATPSVYGMFGLIYKPMDQLSISAFANYMSKREYNTSYGVAELDPRFTVNLKVGYRPVEGFEVFFNGHNLFNSEKREFIYSDEIGGLYTFGINFGF